MTGFLRKRSVSLHGHATSLALEAEFWALIEARGDVARHQPGGADRGDRRRARRGRPLASACRLAALAFARSALSRRPKPATFWQHTGGLLTAGRLQIGSISAATGPRSLAAHWPHVGRALAT